MDPIIAERLGLAQPLARHLDDFLTDLANAGASAHTGRAYRGDLIAFAAHHGEDIAELTAAPVTKWAVRHNLLQANPMDRIDTVKVPKSLPRPAAAADVAKVLAVICSRWPRKDLPLGRRAPTPSGCGRPCGAGRAACRWPSSPRSCWRRWPA
ncbi:MAG: putative recombinase [Nonomuraea muscovyensis]|nr:putative recombinase [Nonomuraea muscovyensis]